MNRQLKKCVLNNVCEVVVTTITPMEAPPSPLSSRAQPRDLQFNLSGAMNLLSRPERTRISQEIRGSVVERPAVPSARIHFDRKSRLFNDRAFRARCPQPLAVGGAGTGPDRSRLVEQTLPTINGVYLLQFGHGTWTDVLGCVSPAPIAWAAHLGAVPCWPFIVDRFRSRGSAEAGEK
jgi:hypothetical protein